MPLSPGDKLGPYEVLSLLGKGGMGEVYRARDPQLNRDVAIKVLPAALVNDADYLAASSARRRHWPRSIIPISPPSSASKGTRLSWSCLQV